MPEVYVKKEMTVGEYLQQIEYQMDMQDISEEELHKMPIEVIIPHASGTCITTSSVKQVTLTGRKSTDIVTRAEIVEGKLTLRTGFIV